MASYDEDLTTIDEWLRRLKIEYDIFFNGHRKKPPDDLRMRVEKQFKRLSEVSDMSFTQRFRYNTLIARFYVYRDLWRRTQQALESSEGVQTADAPTRLAKQKPIKNDAFAEVQVSISDPASEASKLRQLYEAMLCAKRENPQNYPGISFEQFTDYITTQTEKMKRQQHCACVTFRIAREESTFKFTAKAGDSLGG